MFASSQGHKGWQHKKNLIREAPGPTGSYQPLWANAMPGKLLSDRSWGHFYNNSFGSIPLPPKILTSNKFLTLSNLATKWEVCSQMQQSKDWACPMKTDMYPSFYSFFFKLTQVNVCTHNKITFSIYQLNTYEEKEYFIHYLNTCQL